MLKNTPAQVIADLNSKAWLVWIIWSIVLSMMEQALEIMVR